MYLFVFDLFSVASQLRRQEKRRRDSLFALLKSDVVRMKSGKRVRLKKLDSRARRDNATRNLENLQRALNSTGQLLAVGKRQSRPCTADEIQCSDQNQHQQSGGECAAATKRRRKQPVVVELDDDDDDYDSDDDDDEEDEEDEEVQLLAAPTPTPLQSLVLFESQSQSQSFVVAAAAPRPRPRSRQPHFDVEANSPII